MKRFVAAGLALAMTFSLAACKDKDKTGDTASEESASRSASTRLIYKRERLSAFYAFCWFLRFQKGLCEGHNNH